MSKQTDHQAAQIVALTESLTGSIEALEDENLALRKGEANKLLDLRDEALAALRAAHELAQLVQLSYAQGPRTVANDEDYMIGKAKALLALCKKVGVEENPS